MGTSPEDIRSKLEAGRHAVTSSLRRLADEMDRLPLEDATEAIRWVQSQLERLEREAARILRGE